MAVRILDWEVPVDAWKLAVEEVIAATPPHTVWIYPWGQLPPYDFHNTGTPINQEIWDKYYWNPPGNRRDLFPFVPDFLNPIEKPAWATMLQHLANAVRKRIPDMQEHLYHTYERQVMQHVKYMRHKQDMHFLAAHLSATSREGESSQVSRWTNHLFQRYHEMRYALDTASDDLLLGAEICHTTENQHPWAFDHVWADPFWRFHDKLPYFNKHGNVFTAVAAHGPPPTGLLLEQQDPHRVSVTSVSPAVVRLTPADLVDTSQIDFPRAGTQVVILKEGNAGKTLMATAQAYDDGRAYTSLVIE